MRTVLAGGRRDVLNAISSAVSALWTGHVEKDKLELAHADNDPSFVSGAWAGTGVLQMEDKITSCQGVIMRFSGSPGSYNFAGASLNCGDTNQDFPPSTAYDIRQDGQVYFREVHVGHIESDRIHIGNPVAIANKMSDDYTVIRRSDILLFTEAMGLPAATPWFSFVAIMKKTQNPTEH